MSNRIPDNAPTNPARVVNSSDIPPDTQLAAAQAAAEPEPTLRPRSWPSVLGLACGLTIASGVPFGHTERVMIANNQPNTPDVAEASLPRASNSSGTLASSTRPDNPRPDNAWSGSVGSEQAIRPVKEVILSPDRPAVERDNRAPVSTARAPRAKGPRLEIGDKIKLTVYEKVQDEEANKWGKTSSSSTQGFQQRPELSGDYTVQDDGAISLPLIGSFTVSELSAEELQGAVADALEKLTGRKEFVTISSVERPPIYVLGPVKNPGSYKFVPGMTVLHVLALAGGYERDTSDSWQRVESARELQKRRLAVEGVLKALAKASVLKAEVDGGVARPPATLVQLLGSDQASTLVAEQVQRRAAIISGRQDQERALAAAVDAAKQEEQLQRGRLTGLDDLVTLRTKRVEAMQLLLQRGTIGNLVVVQAESELVDAQQRRQDSVNQMTLAKQHLAVAQQQVSKLQTDVRTELQNELDLAEKQISEGEGEFATSDGVLSALKAIPVKYANASSGPDYTYEIVRQKASGDPFSLAANGMTTLQPGDLVNVAPKPVPDSATPALPSRGLPGSSADAVLIKLPGRLE